MILNFICLFYIIIVKTLMIMNMMNTNKISFDKAVVNLLNGYTYLFNCKFGDTSTVFTMDDDAFTLNLAFSKKDENGEYKILGNKKYQSTVLEVPLYLTLMM